MFRNLAALFRYRGLIQTLVVRDLKARYRGSVLGFFWSFINPLLLLLIYSFVFTTVLPGMHPTGDGAVRAVHVLRHPAVDVVLLVAARIVQHADRRREPDQEGAVPGRSAADRHRAGEHGALLPRPADSRRRSSIYYRRPLDPLELLWFPVIVLGAAGPDDRPGLLVSALTVHFRDLKDLLGNLLTLWFFATPIIYPMHAGAGASRWLLNLNPMTHLMISYQEVLFYDGPHGHWRWLLALAAGVGRRCFWPATSCSTACAIASRRKCELTPAIDVVNVSKVYRRYAHKKQFATLKSALAVAAA